MRNISACVLHQLQALVWIALQCRAAEHFARTSTLADLLATHLRANAFHACVTLMGHIAACVLHQLQALVRITLQCGFAKDVSRPCALTDVASTHPGSNAIKA